MMKKVVLIFLILTAAIVEAKWIDVYKRGNIELVPDPEFGKKTDWSSFFYNLNKKIAVAPDGCIFVSDMTQYTIYKFDKEGGYLKSFGQKGQGPGDIINPGDVSILDNRYVVVSESSDINKRISIFTLDASFVDIINAGEFILQAVSLKNNKIAYVTQKEKGGKSVRYTILITDFVTKQTVKVAEFNQGKRRSDIQAKQFYAAVFIAPLNEEYLAVGYSDNPEITVYSSGGKKIRSFSVNMKRLKVTDEMKKEFMEYLGEKMKKRLVIMDSLKKLDTSGIFPEYLPYYTHFTTDPDRDILVFKQRGISKNKELEFQVYSEDGKHLCDSKISFGSFNPANGLRMTYHNDHLYCIVEKNCDGDSCVRLIKVKLR